MRWELAAILTAMAVAASGCTKTVYYPPQILAVEFARGVSSNGAPIEPGKQFPAGIATIYAIFDVGGVKATDVIGGVLYLGNRKILEQKYTAAKVFGGPQQEPRTMWLVNTFSSGAAPGSYRLELSINGKVMRTGTFEVLAR